ncbi:MAG: mechanosensitive ion channel family protein [Thiotrichaceae bacterium]
MQEFITFIQNFGSIGYIILVVNLLLLIFADRLVQMLYHEPDDNSAIRKTRIIRALSLLSVFAYIYFHTQTVKDQGIPLKVLGVIGIIYFSYLVSQLVAYFILRSYGREREINGKKRFVSTYNARLLSIFSGVFIAIMALISIIQMLGYTSLLQAGGVIGFIGVFLALTNAVWAPDIFSGLIILNSDMLEEGDIIEIHDNEPIYALVYKTKVFHTVILNLIDNHRIMIRNSRLRDFTIHNLSKFASAKGLRESLIFNIGYDVPPKKVRAMFEDAYEAVRKQGSIGVESSRDLEIGVQDVGDHAVQWRVYYYTKAVDQLPKIKQQLLETFLKTSNQHGITLSTPFTHVISQSSDSIVPISSDKK